MQNDRSTLNHRPILVTGATGAQGGAIVRALLATGRPVRAVTRDPQSGAAQRLAAQGVEVMQVDFKDASSLAAAAADVAGVFSMQVTSPPDDPEREVRMGKALIAASLAAGVDVFVHTSVARAGEQRSFVGWDEGRWPKGYWDSKSTVNNAVRSAGFARYAILKPAFLMENFASPKAAFSFPTLAQGRLDTAFNSETKNDMIATADVGAFAAAAFADPDRFHGAEIDIAGDSLPLTDIASILSKVTGRPVVAQFLNAEEARAAGTHPAFVNNQEWCNVEGYKVDLLGLAKWNVPLTPFTNWVRDNRNRINAG